jgi:5-methylcytosine-specific restriction endonuclease McrA
MNNIFTVEELINFLSENEVSFDVPGHYGLPKYIVVKALNEFIDKGSSDLILKHKKWTWGSWDINYLKKEKNLYCSGLSCLDEMKELLELKKFFNDEEDIDFLNELITNKQKEEEIKKSYNFKRRTEFTKKLKDECLKRDNYHCVKCDNEFSLEVDHVIELIDGGGNTLSNLQTLCKTCHRKKTNLSQKSRK